MNILMMTNTYKPLMGGLEKSIELFSKKFREKGHRVIIVAPEFEDMVPEEDVIRIPALQNFNGTDFSIQLPIPGVLTEALGDFKPHIIHSHHPFLIGDTALRMAYKYNAPLVFTHHTLYEQNTHYFAADSETLKNFVVQLATGYANLTDRAIAPSASVKNLMLERGVETPIDVVPTGIDTKYFLKGSGVKIRKELKLPDNAVVVGHIGRLAPEKNLEVLVKLILPFFKKNKSAHFVIAGKGPSEESIQSLFQKAGLEKHLHLLGPRSGQDLLDTYHAMDIFVFASQSETQGLVLAEAMASGVPVVAVDAPGVREVVQDQVNGRLLPSEDAASFSAALDWLIQQNENKKEEIKKACLATADEFSMDKSLEKMMKIYSSLIFKEFLRRPSTDSTWEQTLRLIQAHWELAKNLTKATTEALINTAVEKKEI